MITIQHTYSSSTTIIFDNDFRVPLVGTMDEIAERACDKLVKHNFSKADVIENKTGKILMMIRRS